MENKAQENALNIIQKLDNKDFGFYFFVLDGKGNPTGGIANIYEHAKVLTDLGYKAYILHEKNDYYGVGDWLGEEYAALPHVSIEAQNFNMSPQDFIIIPEVLSSLMDQLKQMPAKRVAFCNSYDYILEMLNLGTTWGMYGVNDAITTNQKQVDYIKSLFPVINTHIVPVSIPKYFKNSDKPKKPTIALHTRDQQVGLKIVKAFYIQYPMYKWISFNDLHGMSKTTFANALGESCLAVWVDDISGFGTFPIEAIECETPVVGKIPNLVPEWMEDVISETESKVKTNGIWVNNILAIPELIAQYLKVWLEDYVPTELTEAVIASKGQYTEEIQVEKIKEVYANLVDNRKAEFNNLIERSKQ